MRRQSTLERMNGQRFDVVIVGAGINGAASAAALAARGVSVALVDRGDIGGGTSQESSNLIWGGIKYLQSYEIPLVWALCRSRNRLMQAFPTRIKEIPFLAAVGQTAPFSMPLGAAGVSAYWALGRGRTDTPRAFTTSKLVQREPLVRADGVRGGLQYNDGVLVDHDARFVWDFVRQAGQRGATTINYMAVRGAERGHAGWRLSLSDTAGDADLHIYADVVLNAAGPDVPVMNDTFAARANSDLAFSKGVHLIVPKLGTGDRVLAFFDDESRLFYVIPLHDRSVIGTTDTRVDSPDTTVTEADRTFILEQANRRLALDTPLTRADIIAERCGVRSLVVSSPTDVGNEDWMSLSRRHEIHVDERQRVIMVLGGKLTDCLNVGDKITRTVAQLGIRVGDARRWTSGPPAWYGEEAAGVRHTVLAAGTALAPSSRDSLHGHPRADGDADALVAALWRRQGSRAFSVLDAWKSDAHQATPLFPRTDITRAELALILRDEMVVRPDDLLRRRTPLSLIRTEDELAAGSAMDELHTMMVAAGVPVGLGQTWAPDAGPTAAAPHGDATAGADAEGM